MKTRRLVARLIAPSVLLAGCATTHSLTPVSLVVGPAAREYKSPDLSAFRYATFSVFPLAALNPNASLKAEGDQRGILFSVRNILEARGYRFVSMGANPDFVVGVDAEVVKTEGVTRRTVVEAPEWKPGDTIPTPPASLAALAAMDTWGWGTMPDPLGGVAQLPAWPHRGRKKPKVVDGRWTVKVTVSLLDGKSLGEAWVGTGSGISRVPEVKIASQLVFWMVLHQFPATAMTELTTKGGDLPGMKYEVFTNDGGNYYPGIVEVEDKSRAWKTGIIEYDMMLAVGGEPAWNRSWLDVRRMLTGPPDTRTALTMWRNGTQVNLEGRRVPVSSAPDPGAVEAPPLTGEPSETRKQARLEISRTKVAVDKTWAILGSLTIAALVSAIFSAQK